MSTKMTEKDWVAALEVFRASLPRRGDKGYASKANRQAARKRGIIPVISHKANEKQEPGFFAKAPYRGRARIEQAVGKLKRFKRVALRCEKAKRDFASIVTLTAGFNLVKSVHTA
jgi:IS5 family transposase